MKAKKQIISVLALAAIVLSLLLPASAEAKYSTWFRSGYQEMGELGLLPAKFQSMDLTESISREEMCELAVPALERIVGDEITPARTDYFTDTDALTVLKAHELGIVGGYEDGSFRPEQGLTRQEFFVVLVNFCKAAALQPDAKNASLSKFADGGAVASWAKAAAEICVKYGYVGGSSVGGTWYLKPGEVLSRQEAMTMFLRCYKGLNEYYFYVKNAKVVAFAGSGSVTMVGDVTVTETSGVMYVNTSKLNVRSAPSTSGSILGSLLLNSQVAITGVCGNGWFRISYKGGTGYVAGEYLTAASGSPAVASTRAVAIANYALTFVGYPYVYGGKSPGGGFDCSGLVYYVFGQNGVSMYRVANDQMKQGAPVDAANLLAGDLVFFGYGSYADHVGIYIGNGNFVHASNPRSGVRVSALAETYYARKYLGARRIVTD